MTFRCLTYVLLISSLLCSGAGCTSDGMESEQFITVLQTQPENGQAGVNLETRIRFQIDAPIDPDSLSDQSFFLTNGDAAIVPSSIALTDELDTAELIPSQPLSIATTYTATISADLRSTDGRALEEGLAWEFTSLDSEWGVSEWLQEVATGTSDQPEIVVDGQGNALAVWEYADVAQSVIWANRYTRSGLWGDPEPISTEGDATAPKLAMDVAGNGFAVWRKRETSGDTNIWANRYAVGRGWGDPELLQEGEVTRARLPSIATDPAGNAIAVWAQSDLDVPSTEFVWARRFEPERGWGAAMSIDDETMNGLAGTRTSVGMDDEGNAIAVWARGPSVLWSNRYTSASGWGTAQPIKGDTLTQVSGQRLAVGARGDAFLVWVQSGAGRNDIWGLRFSDSQWGTPERLDAYDAGDKSAPDIAVDGTGVAHAVWSQADPDFQNVWTSQYTPGSGWGPPQLVEPANADPSEDGDAGDARVATNDAGNTFIVWRQVSERWGSVWSNRIDPAMQWDPAATELIEDIDQAARGPKIVVDFNSHAHAIWLHSVTVDVYWVRTNRFE